MQTEKISSFCSTGAIRGNNPNSFSCLLATVLNQYLTKEWEQVRCSALILYAPLQRFCCQIKKKKELTKTEK